MPFDRDAIRTLADRREKVEIDVPGFDEKVYMRELSAEDFERWQLSVYNYDTDASLSRTEVRTAMLRRGRGKLVAMSLCDEQGNRTFSIEDAELLNELPEATMDLLFSVATEVNGATEEARDFRKKSFTATRNGAHGISSPTS